MPPSVNVMATFVSITIATISIVNSLVLSRFNERKLEKRSILSQQISALGARLESRELQTTTYRLLQQSLQRLRSEHKKTRILRPKSYENFMGLPPFALFLLSFLISYSTQHGLIVYPSLQLDITVLDAIANWLFIVGVCLLGPYVFVIMKLLREYLELSTPRPCFGKLHWIEKKLEEKEIQKSFTAEDVLTVAVRFDGTVTNGFIDTLLVCTDGEREFLIWVPDKGTYLSSISYDLYGILHRDPSLDTGILQGRLEEVFHLEFRVGKSSRVGAPISAGKETFFENYVLRKNFQIKQLKIRMYVDPLFVPMLERDYLDELIITNSDLS